MEYWRNKSDDDYAGEGYSPLNADDYRQFEGLERKAPPSAPMATTPRKRTGGGGGGRSGGSSRKSVSEYVNNAVPMDANGNVDYEYMRMADEANMKLLEEQRAEIENMMELERDNSYAPDDQLPDVSGTIQDIGRAALGFAGTQEELPTYMPSGAMQEYIGDTQRMKQVGLSAEEEELREEYAKDVYDADVRNIARLSGGSAGTALANIGGASKRYHDSLAQTAAMDEGVRRQNMSRFAEGAKLAEDINRIQHGEARQEAMMNKEGAAGLLNDALTNMKERADFNKYYGKGSQHYEMLKEDTLDIRHARQDREEARKTNLMTLLQDIDRDMLDLEYRNNGAGSRRYRNEDGTATDYVNQGGDSDVNALKEVNNIYGDNSITREAYQKEMSNLKTMLESGQIDRKEYDKRVNTVGNAYEGKKGWDKFQLSELKENNQDLNNDGVIRMEFRDNRNPDEARLEYQRQQEQKNNTNNTNQVRYE